MSDEYTPGTNRVRDAYVQKMRLAFLSMSAGEYADEFDRWLAERDARIRAEVIDYLAGRIRSIPHWWDADAGYGEFDLKPLGPHRTSEQGAYMEVSRAIDAAREHFGLTKGADHG